MSPSPDDIPRDIPRDDDRACATPRDVARLARMLDEQGREARGGLGEDQLERIFAASDLQLPLGGSVRPVAGRIVPRKPRAVGMPWQIARIVRIAASVAVLASLGVAAFFIQRAWSTGAAGTARETQVAQAPVAPGRDATTPGASPAPQHFEAALEGAVAVRTASTPAAGAVAALAARDARESVAFDDNDMLSEFEPLLGAGSFEGSATASFDDLSGEFALLAQLTAPR